MVSAGTNVAEIKGIRPGAKFSGTYDIDCWRSFDPVTHEQFRNDKGQFEARLVWSEHIHNIITDQGLNHILNVVLHGTAAVGTWYVGMSSSTDTPTSDMTYAVPVFSETTSYSNSSARPAYDESTSTAKSTTNSASQASFTMNATTTLYGAGLFSDTIPKSTTGSNTLFSYAKFATARSVVNLDVVNVTYTITASDDGI